MPIKYLIKVMNDDTNELIKLNIFPNYLSLINVNDELEYVNKYTYILNQLMINKSKQIEEDYEIINDMI